MRGEIFTFEGKSFFVMGGGESDDAYMREESVSWWEDELPSAEDMRNGVNNIRDTDKNINYVITYEPPTVAKDILKQRSNQILSFLRLIHIFNSLWRMFNICIGILVHFILI